MFRFKSGQLRCCVTSIRIFIKVSVSQTQVSLVRFLFSSLNEQCHPVIASRIGILIEKLETKISPLKSRIVTVTINALESISAIREHVKEKTSVA